MLPTDLKANRHLYLRTPQGAYLVRPSRNPVTRLLNAVSATLDRLRGAPQPAVVAVPIDVRLTRRVATTTIDQQR